MTETRPPRTIYYSASQLEKFKRCNRKWAWEYVFGFKPPDNKSQETGNDFHNQVEAWVKGQVTAEEQYLEAVPMSERVKDALQYIKPSPTLEAEGKFNMPLHLPNRVMTGKIDLFDPTPPGRRGIPEIVDIKSTSDVRKYAKTGYQLEADLQLNLYAHRVFERMPEAHAVDIAHLYIQTKGQIKSLKVPTQITRENATNRWHGYLKIVDEMEAARLETDPAKIAYNETACNDYHGCPHKARCATMMFTDVQIEASNIFALAPSERFWESKSPTVGTEALANLLNPPDTTRRKPDDPPATPANVAADSMPKVLKGKDNPMNPLAALAAMSKGKPAEIEQPPAGKVAAFQDKIAQAQARATPAPAAPPTPVHAPTEDVIGAEEEENPPPHDAPACATPAPDPGFEWAVDSKGQAYQRKISAAPGLATKLAGAINQAAPEPSSQEATKKRGRPAGAKNKPKDDAATTAMEGAQAHAAATSTIDVTPKAPEVDVTPSLEREAPPEPAPTDEPNMVDFLFLDCFPAFGMPIGAARLGQWLIPITQQIKANTGAEWQYHEYRKSQGILLEYVRKAKLPSALIVDTRTPEANAIIEFLTHRARVIVQGMK